MSQINIVETISDVLYSDSELVLSSLVDLLETLLTPQSQQATTLTGMAIAGQWADGNMADKSIAENFQQLGDVLARGGEERDDIVMELVSGIGLQKFRFAARLAVGELFLRYVDQVMRKNLYNLLKHFKSHTLILYCFMYFLNLIIILYCFVYNTPSKKVIPESADVSYPSPNP